MGSVKKLAYVLKNRSRFCDEHITEYELLIENVQI